MTLPTLRASVAALILSLLGGVAQAQIAIYGTTAASNAGATYTVGTISGTTVQFDDGAGISGSGTLTNNGLINFNQTSGNSLMISNAIAGTGTLTMMNTGTLQLTAPGTRELNMTINADSGVLIGPQTSGTQTGIFQLGKAGTGTLNVAGGVVATGSSWQVGVGSGTGTINVSSGTFAPRTHLILGGTGGGSGTLNVTGGVVTSGTGSTQGLTIGLQLGMSASSSGLATITSGSVFAIGNTNQIGETGTGTISVNAGGFLQLGEARLGLASTGVGTLNINTSGSANFTSVLTVGGTGRGTLAVNGGLIQVRGGTIGLSAGSLGTVTITSGTWFNNGVGTTEAAGILTVGGSGTGSLTINNGGYVVVTSTFSKHASNGTFTLNQGGTLQIGGVAGNTSAFTVATTGTTGSGASGVLVGDLDFAGTLKFAHGGATASGTATYNGTLSGAGDLVKTGTGVLTVGGSNSYTGGTTLVAGTLVLNSANAIGTTGTIGFEGGTLRYTSFNTTDYSSRFSNAASQQYSIDTNGENITLASNLTSSGGSFTKVGSGTATLTGNNTFTSGSVAGGTLVGSLSSLATTGTFGLSNTATLQFNSGTTSGIWAGVIAGSGTVSKLGAGTLQLTGSGGSTSGTLLISEGAIRGTTDALKRNIVNNSQLTFDQTTSGTYSRTISGTGNLSLFTGTSSSITFTGTSSFTGTATVMGGQLVATRVAAMPAIVVNQASVAFANTQNGTYTGVISGNGSLEKSGIASVTLTGSNTYTGLTTVSEGKLVVNTTSLPGSANVAGAGTLEFDQATSGTYAGNLSGSGVFRKTNDGDLTLTGTGSNTGGWIVSASAGRLIGSAGSLCGNITNNAAVVFDQATNGTYAGSMSGTGTLTKTGVGALTLTGSNSYSGGTTVSAGELIGSTTSLQGAIVNNAAVTFDQATAGTYAGIMSGNGSLKKTGAGTVTLTNASTFTGATTVDAGTLAIAGSGAIASSPTITIKSGATLDVAAASSGWQLASGQTLGGDGTLSGAATALAGAIVAPGEGIGTLTATGGFTLLGTLAIEISGTAIDLLDSSAGALSIGSGTVNFTELLAPVGNLVFAKYLSLSGGTFASVSGLPTGYTIDYAYLGNQIALVQSTPPGPGGVPEIDPAGLGSVIALVAGALGLAERRRSARRAAGRG